MALSQTLNETYDAMGLLSPSGTVTDKVAIVAVTDVAGTITYANDLFVEISGYARTELIGANHRILNSGLHSKQYFIDMYRTIAAGKIWRGEFRNRAKDGHFYWVDTHIIPTLDPQGQVIGYTAVRFDITRRKLAEEAFRKVSQVQTAILDHAGYAIIGTRLDGTIETFNHAAEAMLGYRADEVIGIATPAVFHDHAEIKARIRDAGLNLDGGFESVAAAVRSMQSTENEWTFVRKDGSHFPVLLRVTELRDNERNITGYLGMAVDITDRIEREAALQAAQVALSDRLAELQSANSRIEKEAARQVTLLEDVAVARDTAETANLEKSRFLATMSHEIRTPMNGVIGILGLLRSSGLSDEQQKLVETASRSAEDLIQITSDILDLSKLEARKTELELRDFSVAELADDVISLLRPSAEAKGLKLDCVIKPGLPMQLQGDTHRLRQILINFISNALKFTSEGSVCLVVGHKTGEKGDFILSLRVSDTGIGLDADTVERIFSSFAQADQSITRRFGGTGLGLAICKQLTELMGGRIGVESEPGKGSTFWVEVPLAMGSVMSVETQSHAIEDRPLRLLVAEDNATNQFLMRAILESVGHSVTIAHHGGEAVAMAAEHDFDAILMDVQMPIMDGPTATREIRHGAGRSAKLPIIALTANAMPGDRESYIAAGMDDYVSKPVEPAKLMDVLGRVMARGAVRD